MSVRHPHRGFTFYERLMMIAIVAVLVSRVVPGYRDNTAAHLGYFTELLRSMT